MPKRFQVPEESVAQLEKDLNNLQFEGIPIGGLLVNTLHSDLLMGFREWGYEIRLKDVIDGLNLRFRTNRGCFKNNGTRESMEQMGPGKGLFTFISNSPHLIRINKTIWDLVAEDKKVGLIYKESIRQSFNLEHKDNLIAPSDLLPVEFKHWRAAYNQVRPKLTLLLKKFTSTNKLPFAVARRLENKLMQQSQALIAYRNSLKVLRPGYVVTEHDRYSLTSPLILAARDLGIPSFTMMHGVVNNKFGYLPLIADKLLCWGNRQKDLLDSYGENPDNVVVTGAPQLTNTISSDRQEVRSKLALSEENQVVVLATNPLPPLQREKLLDIFCEALSNSKGLKGIVRLHPSDSVDLYLAYIEKYPDIFFDKNQLLNVDETLGIADLVCVYNSAFSLEALFKGVPISVLNVDPNSLGQGEDLISFGGFQEINSSGSLKAFLDQWLKDPELRQELNDKTKRYASAYCAAFQTEAAEKSLDYIKSQLT